MNNLIAEVISINFTDSLNLTELDFFGNKLNMINLSLNRDLNIGKKVKIYVKPMDIIISKHPIENISIPNKIIATIKEIKNGSLISSIILDIYGLPFESIVGKNSIASMHLKENDEVIALIRASDFFIKEVM